MNTGEIILLVLITLNLCNTMFKHGEDKKPEKYNFYKSFFFMMIQVALFCYAGLFNFKL